MPGMKGSRHSIWEKVLAIYIVAFFLFACQLPAKVFESLRLPELTGQPTPTISPSPTRAGRKPVPITPTSIYLNPTESEYPANASATETPVSMQTKAYPGPGGETTAQATSISTEAYPSIPSKTPGAQETSTDTYPSIYGNTTYPGFATLAQPYNPYPVGTTSPTSGSQEQTTSATAIHTATPTIRPPITATSPSTSVVTMSPTTTSSGNLQAGSQTPTLAPRVPTKTATSFPQPPTAVPSPTRFLTPTSTLTLTPTPTRTPLPYPPWLSVQIYASDPAKVRLAAGEPQLIMFFAYWSGPSLAMAPIIKGVEKEYLGQVNFIYLDIDDPSTAALKAALHYQTEPNFFLVDGQGNVLQSWVGYISVEKLRVAIETGLDYSQ